VFYDTVAEKLVGRSDIQQQASANSPENFGLILGKEFQSGVLDQLGVSEDMALTYIDNPDLQAEVLKAYLPFIQGKAKVAHQEHCDVIELLGPDRRSHRPWSTRPPCAPTPTRARRSSHSRAPH
jgi:type I restriction enzyme R subunit